MPRGDHRPLRAPAVFRRNRRAANKKVKAALAAGFTPILCVGETLAEREGGKTEEVLERQFAGGSAALTGVGVLAYHSCLRAGLGDWHGPHGHAGNGGGAHRILRQQRGDVFTPIAPTGCESSTAAASNPTISRD